MTERKYLACDRCADAAPGQIIENEDKTREALCFTCWCPIRTKAKVLDYINKYGKVQFGHHII